MFIDTHSHLYEESFSGDRAEAVTRALENNVKLLILPNINLDSVSRMHELYTMFPENTAMAIGLHPTDINENWKDSINRIEEVFIENPSSYVAIGEVGIDLYWDKTFRNEQMEAFSRQVDLASNNNLPLIIHCRDGLDETLEILSEKKNLPGMVFHSFGGTHRQVEQIRSIVPDAFFGINGIVTFKNSGLKQVLPSIGLDKLLLETDAPYLAPVPKRGKRNESSYIPFIAQAVADSLNIDIKSVADKTTDNAVKLFKLQEYFNLR